jgi:hypothetical protein
VRHRSAGAQNRNQWFRRRWGNQLDAIRAGLGRESEHNQAPRELWDAIGEAPHQFDFRSCSVTKTACAFCGAKRMCTWKTEYEGETLHMGVCCANLARAWQAFQIARQDKDALETMDHLFDCVVNAHTNKNNYRG